jgi:broad specificity phosphatase PhoE
MGPSDKLVGYIVRHGTTASNEAGLFRGQINVPLDEKGLGDAQQLSKYFADKQLGDAVTSDLDRAVHTSEAILDPKGQVAHQTEDLRAWSLGYLGGQVKADHKMEVGYYQDNPDEVPPRGESLNQFRKRVQPRLKESILKGMQNGVPSLMVAHSSIIHEASHLLHGDHNYAKVEPGGVVGIYHGSKGFHLKELVKKAKKGQSDQYGT